MLTIFFLSSTAQRRKQEAAICAKLSYFLKNKHKIVIVSRSDITIYQEKKSIQCVMFFVYFFRKIESKR